MDAPDRGAAQRLFGFAMILRKGIIDAAPQGPQLFAHTIKGGKNFGEGAVRVKIQQFIGFHRSAMAEKDRRNFAVRLGALNCRPFLQLIEAERRKAG
jgi:hypothetical protein